MRRESGQTLEALENSLTFWNKGVEGGSLEFCLALVLGGLPGIQLR